MRSFFVTLLLLLSRPANLTSIDPPGIHFPLYRRGGSLSIQGLANLTYLFQVLAGTEARFARTYTDVESNRIVRRWHDGPHGPDEYLLDGAGLGGSWYTKLQIGTPPQILEVDIDMLSPDFYTIMTTSGKGSKYDTFASSSHEPSQEQTHPTCLKTTDVLHLPILHSSTSPDNTNNQHLTKKSQRIPFPICQPSKYTHQTLHSSGSILGLSPTTPNINADDKDKNMSPLSRLTTPSLLTNLLQEHTISDPLVHITLLTPTTGLLTLGHPPTYALEKTKVTLEKQLSHLSARDSIPDTTTLESEIAGAMALLVPEGSTPDSLFTWTDAGKGGVKGWHSGMANVWVDDVKVLKNQMVVFDINCPVILMPEGIGGVVFEGVGGMSVESLLARDDHRGSGEDDGHLGDQERGHTFWAYPCLNVPKVEVEIGGVRFPVIARDGFGFGRVDVTWSSNARDDGKDSHNDSDEDEDSGTGYCVSSIVETNMAKRLQWSGSGMSDVWVLGEPFFRTVGLVFDFGDGDGKGGRVGVRKYVG